EKRIMTNLENESGRIQEEKDRRHRRNPWRMPVRIVYAVAACLVLVLSGLVFFSLHTGPKHPDSNPGVVNPWQEYTDVEALQEAVRFKVNLPARMPSQYKVEKIGSIDREVAQLTYSDGVNVIVYRTAQGSEDISGDYNEYPVQKTQTAAGMKVTLKGRGDLIYLAVWSDQTCSYALSIPQGMAEWQVLEILASR
ncbi:MAG TPA: hypothetical protein DD727_00605, partial [Clostridiales bacterium]|nr:hypothetical protein [Clostridiales bacterium]